jgi:3-phenylpropionate/trans-cinnamate dioxygenase ferredoxin reductase subunit
MLGQPVAYDKLPYLYTDQYDVGMEFSGWIGPDGYDRLVTRDDVAGQAFHAFWLADDRLVTGMQVNLWDDGVAPVEELIRSRQPVNPDRLADASVPLAAHSMVQERRVTRHEDADSERRQDEHLRCLQTDLGQRGRCAG